MIFLRTNAQWLIKCNLSLRSLLKPVPYSRTWYLSKQSLITKRVGLLYDLEFLHDLRSSWIFTGTHIISKRYIMSEGEESEKETKNFFAEHAKTGRSACKKCKQKIEAGALRLGKAGYNAFGPEPMKMWYHPECLFEVFTRQRPTTARINGPDDIEGWDALEEEDKKAVLKFLPDVTAGTSSVGSSGSTPKKRPAEDTAGSSRKVKKTDNQKKDESSGVPGHKDNSLEEFTSLLRQLKSDSTYTGKTAMIRNFLEKGSDRDKFKGDIRLWVKLLLPGVIQRIYNLGNLQLVKLFSKIFNVAHDQMLENLEGGDIAETIGTSFDLSRRIRPAPKSTLTLQEVNGFLDSLTKLTKENDQEDLLAKLTKRCTIEDLKTIICLIKGDLRINAGAKHVLAAVHPDAHAAFMTTRDIDKVLAEALKKRGGSLTVGLEVLKGVQPMLAEPCRSVEYALKKFPNGMYAEIKYDGERVQVHKQGTTFKYFSRALKPVSPDKVNLFKDYIPQAFPSGDELILDSEILLIDTNTGKPLPFGTLGVHKRQAFQDSSVCLFVFDCLHFNGTSLLNKPMKERRKILHQVMTEIPNHIMFSETEEIYTSKQLQTKITKVFQLGLEGVVLKGFESIYEPNKRRWLKVKKDYLNDGAMADSADLVVLGAWFGTGQRGGMMSIFLMGCWNPSRKVWIPVTNVATGLDQKTLARIQTELKMTKISKNPDHVPDWLQGPKKIVPDFIATNPKDMPVWEITGAEFSQTEDGISIRFPRVKRFRDDKNWETATNFHELQALYQKSKENTTFNLSPSPSDQQPKDVPGNLPDNKTNIAKHLTKSPAKKPDSGTSKTDNEDSIKQHSNVIEGKKKMKRNDKHAETSKAVRDNLPDNKTNIAKYVTKSPAKKPEAGTSKTNYEDSSKRRSNVIEGNKKVEQVEKHAETSKKESTSPGVQLTPSARAKLRMFGYDLHLMWKCVKEMKNKLVPDLLEGCKVYLIPPYIPRFQSMIHLCGGSVIPCKERHLATHILYGRHSVSYNMELMLGWSAAADHVHHSWLTDSIALMKLQDPKNYRVSLQILE